VAGYHILAQRRSRWILRLIVRIEVNREIRGKRESLFRVLKGGSTGSGELMPEKGEWTLRGAPGFV